MDINCDTEHRKAVEGYRLFVGGTPTTTVEGCRLFVGGTPTTTVEGCRLFVGGTPTTTVEGCRLFVSGTPTTTVEGYRLFVGGTPTTTVEGYRLFDTSILTKFVADLLYHSCCDNQLYITADASTRNVVPSFISPKSTCRFSKDEHKPPSDQERKVVWSFDINISVYTMRSCGLGYNALWPHEYSTTCNKEQLLYYCKQSLKFCSNCCRR